MKNTLIIISLLMFGTMLTAQEANTPTSSLRINILSPGIGGEFQIAPAQTLSANFNFEPLILATFPAEDTGLESTYYFGALPTFDLEYRFYYNRQKRIEKGRSIYNNSGAYLAPRLRYSTNPIQVAGDDSTLISAPRLETGGMIGYQKTFNSNLQLGIAAGMGLGVYSSGASSTFLAAFNFSYIIIPKKWRYKS